MSVYDRGLHALSRRRPRSFERKATTIGDEGWKRVWKSAHEIVMPVAENIPIAQAFVPLADVAYAKATGDTARIDEKKQKAADLAKKTVEDKKKEEAKKTAEAKKSRVLTYVAIGTVALAGTAIAVMLLRKR